MLHVILNTAVMRVQVDDGGRRGRDAAGRVGWRSIGAGHGHFTVFDVLRLLRLWLKRRSEKILFVHAYGRRCALGMVVLIFEPHLRDAGINNTFRSLDRI